MDDDEPSLEILKRLLAKRGHVATTATSVDAARVLLRSGEFDAVLLDHVLPGVTGSQALREFRTLTKAPLYIMSGYNDPDFQKDALLLGAAGFLSKPLDFDLVTSILEALPG